MGFDSIWSDLTSRLQVGSKIKAWSRAKGYTGLEFQVVDVDSTLISVDKDGLSAPRRISRGDIAKVIGVRDDYIAGRLQRSEMSHISQNTTYILDLLHWLETQRKPA